MHTHTCSEVDKMFTPNDLMLCTIILITTI